MRLITERAGIPEPYEEWLDGCDALTDPLEEYGRSRMHCTRPKGHDGPHMAAFTDDCGAGPDIVGPIWED